MHAAVDDIKHATVGNDHDGLPGMGAYQSADAIQNACLMLPDALAPFRGDIVRITMLDRPGIFSILCSDFIKGHPLTATEVPLTKRRQQDDWQMQGVRNGLCCLPGTQ